MAEDHEPLLFRSLPRQRMLIALARLGPLRTNDAVRLGGGRFPSVEEFANFEKTGLIVRYGPERQRLIALNAGHPAAEGLRRLLLEWPSEPVEKNLPTPSLDTPTVDQSICDTTELFGPRAQTAIIIAVCLAGGSIDDARLRLLIRRDSTNSTQYTRAIDSLKSRRVIILNRTHINLDPQNPENALVQFVKSLVAQRPAYEHLAKMHSDSPQDTRDSVKSRIPWRDAPKGRARPRGLEASSDGAPLLFGSNARFRVFTALARHKTLPPAELIRIAKIAKGTFPDIVKSGFVVVEDIVSKRYRRIVCIHPDIPAREEFIALLIALENRWPAKSYKIDHFEPDVSRAHYTWSAGLSKYFGSENRTETLLMLAALGQGDASTIHRALPAYDIQEATRTLEMLRHYGIVRNCGKEGTAMMLEFDPTWFASTELRVLLEALLRYDTRYGGKKYAAESAMSPRRKKMRDNARARMKSSM